MNFFVLFVATSHAQNTQQQPGKNTEIPTVVESVPATNGGDKPTAGKRSGSRENIFSSLLGEKLFDKSANTAKSKSTAAVPKVKGENKGVQRKKVHENIMKNYIQGSELANLHKNKSKYPIMLSTEFECAGLTNLPESEIGQFYKERPGVKYTTYCSLYRQEFPSSLKPKKEEDEEEEELDGQFEFKITPQKTYTHTKKVEKQLNNSEGKSEILFQEAIDKPKKKQKKIPMVEREINLFEDLEEFDIKKMSTKKKTKEDLPVVESELESSGKKGRMEDQHQKVIGDASSDSLNTAGAKPKISGPDKEPQVEEMKKTDPTPAKVPSKWCPLTYKVHSQYFQGRKIANEPRAFYSGKVKVSKKDRRKYDLKKKVGHEKVILENLNILLKVSEKQRELDLMEEESIGKEEVTSDKVPSKLKGPSQRKNKIVRAHKTSTQKKAPVTNRDVSLKEQFETSTSSVQQAATNVSSDTMEVGNVELETKAFNDNYDVIVFTFEDQSLEGKQNKPKENRTEQPMDVSDIPVTDQSKGKTVKGKFDIKAAKAKIGETKKVKKVTLEEQIAASSAMDTSSDKLDTTTEKTCKEGSVPSKDSQTERKTYPKRSKKSRVDPVFVPETTMTSEITESLADSEPPKQAETSVEGTKESSTDTSEKIVEKLSEEVGETSNSAPTAVFEKLIHHKKRALELFDDYKSRTKRIAVEYSPQAKSHIISLDKLTKSLKLQSTTVVAAESIPKSSNISDNDKQPSPEDTCPVPHVSEDAENLIQNIKRGFKNLKDVSVVVDKLRLQSCSTQLEELLQTHPWLRSRIYIEEEEMEYIKPGPLHTKTVEYRMKHGGIIQKKPKKQISYHKRLSSAFIKSSKRKRRSTGASPSFMTALSNLHKAIVDASDSKESSSPDSEEYVDSMFNMSYMSPKVPSPGKGSPPQAESPTATPHLVETEKNVEPPLLSDSQATDIPPPNLDAPQLDVPSENSPVLYAVKEAVVKINTPEKQKHLSPPKTPPVLPSRDMSVSPGKDSDDGRLSPPHLGLPAFMEKGDGNFSAPPELVPIEEPTIAGPSKRQLEFEPLEPAVQQQEMPKISAADDDDDTVVQASQEVIKPVARRGRRKGSKGIQRKDNSKAKPAAPRKEIVLPPVERPQTRGAGKSPKKSMCPCCNSTDTFHMQKKSKKEHILARVEAESNIPEKKERITQYSTRRRTSSRPPEVLEPLLFTPDIVSSVQKPRGRSQSPKKSLGNTNKVVKADETVPETQEDTETRLQEDDRTKVSAHEDEKEVLQQKPTQTPLKVIPTIPTSPTDRQPSAVFDSISSISQAIQDAKSQHEAFKDETPGSPEQIVEGSAQDIADRIIPSSPSGVETTDTEVVKLANQPHPISIKEIPSSPVLEIGSSTTQPIRTIPTSPSIYSESSSDFLRMSGRPKSSSEISDAPKSPDADEERSGRPVRTIPLEEDDSDSDLLGPTPEIFKETSTEDKKVTSAAPASPASQDSPQSPVQKTISLLTEMAKEKPSELVYESVLPERSQEKASPKIIPSEIIDSQEDLGPASPEMPVVKTGEDVKEIKDIPYETEQPQSPQLLVQDETAISDMVKFRTIPSNVYDTEAPRSPELKPAAQAPKIIPLEEEDSMVHDTPASPDISRKGTEKVTMIPSEPVEGEPVVKADPMSEAEATIMMLKQLSSSSMLQDDLQGPLSPDMMDDPDMLETTTDPKEMKDVGPASPEPFATVVQPVKTIPIDSPDEDVDLLESQHMKGKKLQLKSMPKTVFVEEAQPLEGPSSPDQVTATTEDVESLTIPLEEVESKNLSSVPRIVSEIVISDTPKKATSGGEVAPASPDMGPASPNMEGKEREEAMEASMHIPLDVTEGGSGQRDPRLSDTSMVTAKTAVTISTEATRSQKAEVKIPEAPAAVQTGQPSRVDSPVSPVISSKKILAKKDAETEYDTSIPRQIPLSPYQKGTLKDPRLQHIHGQCGCDLNSSVSDNETASSNLTLSSVNMNRKDIVGEIARSTEAPASPVLEMQDTCPSSPKDAETSSIKTIPSEVGEIVEENWPSATGKLTDHQTATCKMTALPVGIKSSTPDVTPASPGDEGPASPEVDSQVSLPQVQTEKLPVGAVQSIPTEIDPELPEAQKISYEEPSSPITEIQSPSELRGIPMEVQSSVAQESSVSEKGLPLSPVKDDPLYVIPQEISEIKSASSNKLESKMKDIPEIPQEVLISSDMNAPVQHDTLEVKSNVISELPDMPPDLQSSPLSPPTVSFEPSEMAPGRHIPHIPKEASIPELKSIPELSTQKVSSVVPIIVPTTTHETPVSPDTVTHEAPALADSSSVNYPIVDISQEGHLSPQKTTEWLPTPTNLPKSEILEKIPCIPQVYTIEDGKTEETSLPTKDAPLSPEHKDDITSIPQEVQLTQRIIDVPQEVQIATQNSMNSAQIPEDPMSPDTCDVSAVPHDVSSGSQYTSKTASVVLTIPQEMPGSPEMLENVQDPREIPVIPQDTSVSSAVQDNVGIMPSEPEVLENIETVQDPHSPDRKEDVPTIPQETPMSPKKGDVLNVQKEISPYIPENIPTIPQAPVLSEIMGSIPTIPAEISEKSTEIMEVVSDAPVVSPEVPEMANAILEEAPMSPEMPIAVPPIFHETPASQKITEIPQEVPLSPEIQDASLLLPKEAHKSLKISGSIPLMPQDVSELKEIPDIVPTVPKETSVSPEIVTDVPTIPEATVSPEMHSIRSIPDAAVKAGMFQTISEEPTEMQELPVTVPSIPQETPTSPEVNNILQTIPQEAVELQERHIRVPTIPQEAPMSPDMPETDPVMTVKCPDSPKFLSSVPTIPQETATSPETHAVVSAIPKKAPELSEKPKNVPTIPLEEPDLPQMPSIESAIVQETPVSSGMPSGVSSIDQEGPVSPDKPVFVPMIQQGSPHLPEEPVSIPTIPQEVPTSREETDTIITAQQDTAQLPETLSIPEIPKEIPTSPMEEENEPAVMQDVTEKIQTLSAERLKSPEILQNEPSVHETEESVSSTSESDHSRSIQQVPSDSSSFNYYKPSMIGMALPIEPQFSSSFEERSGTNLSAQRPSSPKYPLSPPDGSSGLVEYSSPTPENLVSEVKAVPHDISPSEMQANSSSSLSAGYEPLVIPHAVMTPRESTSPLKQKNLVDYPSSPSSSDPSEIGRTRHIPHEIQYKTRPVQIIYNEGPSSPVALDLSTKSSKAIPEITASPTNIPASPPCGKMKSDQEQPLEYPASPPVTVPLVSQIPVVPMDMTGDADNYSSSGSLFSSLTSSMRSVPHTGGGEPSNLYFEREKDSDNNSESTGHSDISDKKSDDLSLITGDGQNDSIEATTCQNSNVVLTPASQPPSREYVKGSCLEHGISEEFHQDVYCSKSNDLPNRPR